MERTHRLSFNIFALTAVATLLLGGASIAMASSTSDLEFSGDGSFNGAHGGQAIAVAVVSADGAVVATRSGTVSAADDPSFSFTFPDTLENGESYEVHYWIDSNFGGGSEGNCDPKDNDHQWVVPLGTVNGNVSHTEAHRPAETADVCETFE